MSEMTPGQSGAVPERDADQETSPDTDAQMKNLEAVLDYLATARRYVGQAVDEMSEVDYSPLMPTDVAVRLGLITHSVLMSLDEALSYIQKARGNGRKALARKEID